jgi:hypothetical protein
MRPSLTLHSMALAVNLGAAIIQANRGNVALALMSGAFAIISTVAVAMALSAALSRSDRG